MHTESNLQWRCFGPGSETTFYVPTTVAPLLSSRDTFSRALRANPNEANLEE